ncbi:transcriptional regulator [Paenibacillus sp. BIHB 4019]|uniref:Transcriptional regulator n=1 Tax=Paenibacillus sp. BIHB 4019 TaxID=1870819 RepID=A0A1B2DEX7_9BACL|nr:helix-turn-helix transcriptional regulator [Paenibacillus sp. BIHB 4019]ANY66271.1 transcriptional regulator [Paenibacillus sp. BIHB 4019]
MNLDAILGQVLKALRKKHKVSQEELAFRSTLDRTYISMLERGIHQPSLNSLITMAQIVKIKASDLVSLYEIELEKLNEHNNVNIDEDRP